MFLLWARVCVRACTCAGACRRVWVPFFSLSPLFFIFSALVRHSVRSICSSQKAWRVPLRLADFGFTVMKQNVQQKQIEESVLTGTARLMSAGFHLPLPGLIAEALLGKHCRPVPMREENLSLRPVISTYVHRTFRNMKKRKKLIFCVQPQYSV